VRAWLSGVIRRRNSTYSSEWKNVISSDDNDSGWNTWGPHRAGQHAAEG
jgi:hypothetical protein